VGVFPVTFLCIPDRNQHPLQQWPFTAGALTPFESPPGPPRQCNWFVLVFCGAPWLDDRIVREAESNGSWPCTPFDETSQSHVPQKTRNAGDHSTRTLSSQDSRPSVLKSQVSTSHFVSTRKMGASPLVTLRRDREPPDNFGASSTGIVLPVSRDFEKRSFLLNDPRSYVRVPLGPYWTDLADVANAQHETDRAHSAGLADAAKFFVHLLQRRVKNLLTTTSFTSPGAAATQSKTHPRPSHRFTVRPSRPASAGVHCKLFDSPWYPMDTP